MQNRNGISQDMLRASRHLKKLYVIVCAVTSKYSQSPDSLIRTMYHPHPLPPQPGSTAGTKFAVPHMANDADTAIGSPIKPKGFAMSFIQAAVRGRVDSERAGRNSAPRVGLIISAVHWTPVSKIQSCGGG